jgi:hypothetical protein
MKSNKVIITGFGPLLIRVAGTLSNVLLRFRFAMTGVSPARETGIILSRGTNCTSSACHLFLVVSEALLVLGLQVLYKPVNRCYAMLFGFLRMVQATIRGVNMLGRYISPGTSGDPVIWTRYEPQRMHLSALQSCPGFIL